MSEELAAKDALRALGIAPTPALVRSWIQANRVAEELILGEPQQSKPSQFPPERPENADVRPKHPRGYSKSRLEPTLRTEGTLQRQPGIRRRGRPRVVASWFKELAELMADGIPLRSALKRAGISLDAAQRRALYRNVEFQRMYQNARRNG
jgi:hypothetical protein